MRGYIVNFAGAEVLFCSFTGADSALPTNIPCKAALKLLPSEKYDFELRSIGALRVEQEHAEAILSCFFSTVRGYPSSELSVLYDSVPLNIQIFDTPRGYFKQRFDKCKLICTKKAALGDSVEVSLYTYLSSGKKVRVIETQNIYHFDRNLLSRLRVVDDLPDCSAALAVCLSDSACSIITSASSPSICLYDTTAHHVLSKHPSASSFLDCDSGAEILISVDGTISVPCKISPLF